MYVTHSMYKMATAGVPSGTILAVYLQKCSHLSNERVMQNFLHSKSLYDIFSEFHRKDSKTLIWQGQKQHLRNKKQKNLTPQKWDQVCFWWYASSTSYKTHVCSFWNCGLTSLGKRKKNLPALKNCPMLIGETNNQFYMA